MAWIEATPTQEGYYWVKAAGVLTGKFNKHVVHVYSSDHYEEKPDTVFWDGENFSIDSYLFKKWWDEPIEVPED
jgi:hypothetical protein